MIEREVTDLISISFGAFLISITFSQDNYQFNDYALLVVGLLIVIMSSFIHIVFHQLQYISKKGSRGFAAINSIGIVLSISGLIINRLDDTEGFWKDIPGGFTIMLLLGIISIISANLLSFKARLANLK